MEQQITSSQPVTSPSGRSLPRSAKRTLPAQTTSSVGLGSATGVAGRPCFRLSCINAQEGRLSSLLLPMPWSPCRSRQPLISTRSALSLPFSPIRSRRTSEESGDQRWEHNRMKSGRKVAPSAFGDEPFVPRACSRVHDKTSGCASRTRGAEEERVDRSPARSFSRAAQQ